LEHGIETGTDNIIYEVMVSWIPSDIATVGNTVRLKELGADDWSEGWKVMETWATQKGDRVEAAMPEFKHHRKRSDV
jgi:hypothetical protein